MTNWCNCVECIGNTAESSDETMTAEPTAKDIENGWQVNVELINHLEKVVTYPAHSQAIEQIVLELIRLKVKL